MQHTGVQLLSLGSHSRQSCQSCAHIQDPPGNCCVLHPSVSLESGESVYTVRSPAGSYECSESGLRWSCPGPVTLQYRISKEEIFWAQLQMLQCRPVGPPLEIKLLSGELEEVHLPHSLCLGGSDPGVLGDAVRALHGDDSVVSLETCELTRFHGKLRAQHFSIWQLVASWGVPVKSHCEVLIYEHCPRPLVLHTFLLPSPSSAQQAVQDRWGGGGIVKPSPDHSLWVASKFRLCCSATSSFTPSSSTPSSSTPSSSTPSSSAAPSSSPSSSSPSSSTPSLKITPTGLTLSYRNPPTFFEVFVRNPLEEFKLEIKDADDHTVWEVELRQGVDYNKTKDQAGTHTSGSCTATSNLTDQQLLMVAKLMGKEWKQVGIGYLGLSMQELDKIQEAEQDVTLQRFRMLDQWKRQQKGKAGPTELHRCLNEDDVPNAVRDCLEDMAKGTCSQ